MEQGISTPSTKERLLDLESQKSDLEQRIARESMKKPPLSKERVMHWLYSFKGGDINDTEYRRRVIDTLVNSIYVYDSDDGEGIRKITLTFNISGHNTSTIKCSDIARFAPPHHHLVFDTNWVMNFFILQRLRNLAITGLLSLFLFQGWGNFLPW